MQDKISKATKVALTGNVKRARMSAIAFTKSGEIIAFSPNRRTNGDPTKFTEHAEEGLLKKLERIKAFNRYKDITILVLRISSYGVSMAKPCKRCQNKLSKYPVSVIFTNENGDIQKL